MAVEQKSISFAPDPDVPACEEWMETPGGIRAWLMGHPSDQPLQLEGWPLWVVLFQHGLWESVHELIQEPLWRLHINSRDNQQRGWLHLGIVGGAPTMLMAWGLTRLDRSWADPDSQGRSPMECLPTAALAQRLAGRWWAEHPREADRVEAVRAWSHVAVEAHRPDLVRVWSFWLRRRIWPNAPDSV